MYAPAALEVSCFFLFKNVFGVVVWVASYFGLLPLLGLVESGPKEPPQRNLMMLAAHLVWGSAMGATADVLIADRGRRRLPS
jgi:uncharacterized membrane protein YagU involved in acid resistance